MKILSAQYNDGHRGDTEQPLNGAPLLFSLGLSSKPCGLVRTPLFIALIVNDDTFGPRWYPLLHGKQKKSVPCYGIIFVALTFPANVSHPDPRSHQSLLKELVSTRKKVMTC